ncbi:MAG: FMN-binding protein [Acetobacterium sp.]
MKKAVIIIGCVVGVLVLIIGGGILYITNGLHTGEKLGINAVDLTQIQDGTYSGTYESGRWSNAVDVTVSGKKITQIDVVKSVSFEQPEVTETIINAVIEKQNTTVDTVSGATVTSKAYLKSVENALTK